MSQNEDLKVIQQSGEPIIKDIKVLGIDLAKSVFQLHGTNARVIVRSGVWTNKIGGVSC